MPDPFDRDARIKAVSDALYLYFPETKRRQYHTLLLVCIDLITLILEEGFMISTAKLIYFIKLNCADEQVLGGEQTRTFEKGSAAPAQHPIEKETRK